MARRKKAARGERSEAIRTYLAAHNGASVGDVKAALKEKGIDVSDSLINSIKYKKTSGKRKGRRRRKLGRNGRVAAVSGISVQDLVTAKEMVNRLGGIEAAGMAIDVLKKLQS
jgi:hypothetical protein